MSSGAVHGVHCACNPALVRNILSESGLEGCKSKEMRMTREGREASVKGEPLPLKARAVTARVIFQRMPSRPEETDLRLEQVVGCLEPH